MRFQPLLLSALAALALLLTGCISSKIPLFDEAQAVIPAPAGRYDELVNNNGNWEKRATGTLRLDARLYGWKEDRASSEQLFALYDVGNGFYVATGRQRNPQLGDPYLYELFEVTKDGYLAYAPRCADLRKLRLPEKLMPIVDGTDCFYVDREVLVQVLRLWAERMLPTYRYITARP
jgi:hypothetical protein